MSQHSMISLAIIQKLVDIQQPDWDRSLPLTWKRLSNMHVIEKRALTIKHMASQSIKGEQQPVLMGSLYGQARRHWLINAQKMAEGRLLFLTYLSVTIANIACNLMRVGQHSSFQLHTSKHSKQCMT